MHRLVVLAVAAALPIATTTGVAAVRLQTPPPTLDVPAAEECQGDPQRSVAVLFATPTAEPEAASPTPFVPPAGQPADEATAAAMTATIRAVLACLNSGQYFPLLTLVSDDYLRDRFAAGAPADPLSQELAPFVEALRGCETCEIEPRSREERFGIVAIDEPRRLDDGRAAVVLRVSSPATVAAGQTIAVFVAFVPSGQRLLVDEIVDLTATTATPTP